MKWRDKKLKIQHLQQPLMCRRTFGGNSGNNMNRAVTQYYSNLKARMTRYIIQYEKGLNLKAETSFSHYGPDEIHSMSKSDVAYNGSHSSGL
jgi:hypothetical protein